MKTLNQKQAGDKLYEIEFTPKGKTEKTALHVWAKNKLAASNYLILNKIWGTQHQILEKGEN